MNTKKEILNEILGTPYNSKNELLYFCPFCKHHKKKLSINLEKSVFKCWVCDTRGGISYIVKRYGSREKRHQWELLNQEIDLSLGESLFTTPLEEEQTLSLPKEYLCLAHKHLPYSAREALSYLTARGISSPDILFYKIGYCDSGKYRKRIIIPSFNMEGKCNYFSARSYKNDWLKYKNPPVSKNIIFNDLLIDWKSPITLVEGAFDAIKISNSIPILGSTINENSNLFKKIVSQQPKVYLGLDRDVINKSLQIISSMLQYGVEVYFLDTSEIDDIGSVSKYEAEKLKENSLPMSTESIFNIYWSN